MPRTWQPPLDSEKWMTEEIRELLRQFQGRHAVKKRTTIIKVAFALANRQSLKQLFREPDVCAETVWYQKWRHQPRVKAAFEACYARALDWMDEETVRIQAHYRRKRQQAVAEYAAEAPVALKTVMETDERGANRIKAATTLIALDDPEATPLAAGGSLDAEVAIKFERDLAQVYGSDESVGDLSEDGEASGMPAGSDSEL